MHKLDTLRLFYEAGYTSLAPWANRKNPNRYPLMPSYAPHNWDEVVAWNTRFGLADWAYRPSAGIVILDLEMKNGLNGIRELRQLGPDFQPAMRVQSFSGGFHYYFRSKAHFTGGWSLRPGIEVKSQNGSVHIPPSEGCVLLTPIVKVSELPFLPEWLEVLLANEVSLRRTRKNYAQPIYTEGERRQKLCSMAGALRNLGLTEPELQASLRAIAISRCEGCFPEAEVDGIAKDYATRDVGTEGLALSGDPVAASVVAFIERSRK